MIAYSRYAGWQNPVREGIVPTTPSQPQSIVYPGRSHLLEGRHRRLDPEVIGTPSFDRRFDLLLVESLERLLSKCRELGIRSKP